MQKLFENWRKYQKETLNEQFSDVGLIGRHERPLRDADLSGMGEALYKGFFKRLARDTDQALHVRAFAKYLAHDTSILTEDFLTESEKRWLVRFIIMADIVQGKIFRRQRKKEGSGWIESNLEFTPERGPMRTGGPLHTDGKIIIGYRDYDRVTKGNVGHARQDLTAGLMPQQFERFLGQFTANWDGEDTMQISDVYDFSGKKFKDIKKQLMRAARNFGTEFSREDSGVSGPLYKFIRNLAPHPAVGTPYKVNLTLTGFKEILPSAHAHEQRRHRRYRGRGAGRRRYRGRRRNK